MITISSQILAQFTLFLANVSYLLHVMRITRNDYGITLINVKSIIRQRFEMKYGFFGGKEFNNYRKDQVPNISVEKD